MFGSMHQSATESSNDEQSFPLLDLPYEIRIHLYRAHIDCYGRSPDPTSSRFRFNDQFHALEFVCKRVMVE